MTLENLTKMPKTNHNVFALNPIYRQMKKSSKLTIVGSKQNGYYLASRRNPRMYDEIASLNFK